MDSEFNAYPSGEDSGARKVERREENRGQRREILQDQGCGGVFLCPLSALKPVEDATEEELANCVEEEVVHRYAGDIKIVK